MMINLDDILLLDFAYLATFTNRIDTSWGTLFYNESQSSYYDANHAHIRDSAQDPDEVIDEVVRFYQARNLTPRFYIHNLELQQELISKLKSHSFQYEELITPVQLWNNRVIEMEENNRTTIEKVTEENYIEALNIECSITEFGGKDAVEKVFEKQFNHPAFTHYLLRYDGVPCSTACIFEHETQARVESVATLEGYRGKGLVGEIIQFIQTEATKRGINKLWIFPINESVEKVYHKYGFQTVGKLEMGHAFLGGKSIKEIQGS